MKYVVAEGYEFSYPADSESEGIIKNAGGRLQLSDEDQAKIKFKTVKEGDDCGDMPKSALELYFSRGWIVDPDAIAVVELAAAVESEPVAAIEAEPAAAVESEPAAAVESEPVLEVEGEI